MSEFSQHVRGITRPAAVRGILLVMMFAAVLGAVSLYVTQVTAGAPTQVTVNSVANIHAGGDTGDCDSTPGSGTCTFGQAINYVNAGFANEIIFHPPVFSSQSPGTIDLTLGDGLLPIITNEVTINAEGVGVILDGGGIIPIGVHVIASHNGFDFTLLGGGETFVVQGMGSGQTQIDPPSLILGGPASAPTNYIAFESVGILVSGMSFAVRVCVSGELICPDGAGTGEAAGPGIGGPFTLGDVLIDGVHVRDTTGIGILIDALNLHNIAVTNSEIAAGADGVFILADATPGTGILSDNMVNVTGNSILGGDNSVEIDFVGDLASKILANVSDNVSLTGLGSDAVNIDYCCGGDAGGSAINFMVNNNAKIHGSTYGVQMDIFATGVPAGGGATDVDVQVNGNGRVDAGDIDAVEIDGAVCCANSDSTSTISVSNNADLIGDSDGIDIDFDLCCGDGNDSIVMVNDNERIEGQDDDGVDIDVNIGDVSDLNASGIFDSDDNTSLVQVNGNGNIDGGGGEGVEIDVDLGSDTGDADDNTSEIEVIGNGPIDGDDSGIDMDVLEVGSDDGDSADDNVLKVTITDNASIDGDDDEGINIHTHVGVFGAEDDGDDNSTEIIIENNGSIEGGEGDGIEVDSFTGGDIPGSGGNSNSLRIVQNDDIIGQSTGSADGIEIDFIVCCDPANTNTITISDNKGDIVGLDDDGIDIFVCCSVNTVTISDNQGEIRGNDGGGIDYGTAFGYPGCSTCPDDPLDNSVNILTITGNTISNSEDDGINIGAGAFEADGVGKSVIADNVIDHNSDHGIAVWCTSGLNIGPGNQIFENGDDPTVDAGVEISASGCAEKIGVDGRSNTITQNMIWGNIGLGIELRDSGNGHGVGCDFTGGPSQPNDCIPFPDLVTQSGDKLIGTSCAGCHIEVFWAHNAPDDQDNHGEGAEYIMTGTADAVTGDFSFDLPCDLGAGDLTATATDKIKNTSEFAENLPTLGTSECATPTPEPTETPVATGTPEVTDTPVPPTATPEPAKVCGDVDGDGSVSSIDASLIFQLKAGFLSSLDNESSADVNDDGAITSVDGALILQVGAGFITEAALTCP